MALSYSVRIAFQSLMREKLVNLLSVLTIAAGLFFISLSVVALRAIDEGTRGLPEKFSVMVYLNENYTAEERTRVMEAAEKDPAVRTVRFISKDEALKTLRADMKGMEEVLAGLPQNPLPDSIQIGFREQSVSPEAVKKLSVELQRLRGIKEIEYGEKFLASLYDIRKGVKTIGAFFVAIMSAGMFFVCYSTVKILFYRRERDIETFKLLGATKSFIRTPFLLEGAVIGICGGVAGLFGILALHYMVFLKLKTAFPVLGAISFPLDMLVAVPLAGLLLGIFGAAMAIGRIKY